MPTVVSGNNKDRVNQKIYEVNYDYDYPQDLDLKPGSEIHEKLKDEILERARESHSVVSNRFDSWNEIDRVMNCYIQTDDEEKDIKSNDPRKPVSIVFPYSYAILETLTTYLVTAFLQDPIFQYEGVSPEDTIGAKMLTKVVQKHCLKNKVALNLHTMFLDSLKYGVAYTAPDWEIRWGTKRVRETQGRFSSLGRLVGRQPAEREEEGILFEGNSLNNIDPYLSLPDPKVSIHELQKGEFFGWIEETSLVGVLNDEVNDQDVFNARYVKHLGEGKTYISRNESDREQSTTRNEELSENVSFPVDVIHMYITLIPEDWGLGDSEYPEKWMFALAGDEVIIKAKPLNLNHGMYPIAGASPDYDGYSPFPTSRMESLYGLQHLTDWLMNSHVANVRKSINDMLVVDPYSVNMNDLRNPEPGKLIRMRRPMWGQGVKDVVQQLGVTDVTRQNISDANFLVNWMNHVAGADESMMGSLRQGGPERLTAAEFQGTRGSAVSRLERMARVMGLQAMQDIGYLFASHTQQMMSQDSYIDISGEWEKRLKKIYGTAKARDGKMKVSPFDVDVDYDVSVRDGSIPGSNMSQAWIDLFKIVAETPELQQQFSVTRIFQHIARGMGAKNVQEFIRQNGQGQGVQAQGMPDEQVDKEVQKGNLRPMGADNE